MRNIPGPALLPWRCPRERRSQAEWQDWSCRRGEIRSIRDEDAIEIGIDGAKDAEEIELLLGRNGGEYPPHEHKTGNLDR